MTSKSEVATAIALFFEGTKHINTGLPSLNYNPVSLKQACRYGTAEQLGELTPLKSLPSHDFLMLSLAVVASDKKFVLKLLSLLTIR